jgi:hypothetical protein
METREEPGRKMSDGQECLDLLGDHRLPSRSVSDPFDRDAQEGLDELDVLPAVLGELLVRRARGDVGLPSGELLVLDGDLGELVEIGCKEEARGEEEGSEAKGKETGEDGEGRREKVKREKEEGGDKKRKKKKGKRRAERHSVSEAVASEWMMN